MGSARQGMGRRIKSLRVERGLTQSGLAHKTGLNRTYLSGVENGMRNVSIDNLVRIAQGLDVTLFSLTNGIDTEYSGKHEGKR